MLKFVEKKVLTTKFVKSSLLMNIGYSEMLALRVPVVQFPYVQNEPFI